MNAIPTDVLRPPPHNTEAEQALLGAILINNRNLEKVSDFLRPEHFAYPIHGRIFDLCGALINKGQRADPITVKGELEADGVLEDGGGASFLTRLASPGAGIIDCRDYGQIILDMHRRRSLIALAANLTEAAYTIDHEITPADMATQAEADLFALMETGGAEGEGPVSLDISLDEALAGLEASFKSGGAAVGTTTGFLDIDRVIGALPSAEVTVLAARPSMGKSALAANIAINVARRGGKVLFFSLEMNRDKIGQRVIAAEAKVTSSRARGGAIAENEMTALIEARQRLRGYPLHIDHTGRIKPAQLRQRARRVARKIGGLDMIVIDYLQLMEPNIPSRDANRVTDVSSISRELKLLAKELNVPILALSQLSRAVESRDDKRPMLSDLRESGAIEQDAAVVMFLYREEYYLERAEPKMKPGEAESKYRERFADHATRLTAAQGIAEIGIPKNRFGPVTTVRLHFDGPLMQFHNLAHGDGGGL